MLTLDLGGFPEGTNQNITNAKLFWIADSIPRDIGGGSGFDKLAVMDTIARLCQLRSYLEIGVWHGRSFFPMSASFASRGGRSVGVDPYFRDAAFQQEMPNAIRETVERFIRDTDYDAVYRATAERQRQFGLTEASTLLRQTSVEAAPFLDASGMVFDMLHVDGNHDHSAVLADLSLHLPRLSPQGFVVLDDIDWPSVGPAVQLLEARMVAVHRAETYAIFGPASLTQNQLTQLSASCHAAEIEARALLDGTGRPLPLVSVWMITHNHERFVAHALESVLCQKRFFGIEIVISDDASEDRTAEIIGEYAARHPDLFRFKKRSKNVGVVRNYVETLLDCQGKYVAFLEGDDFWTDPQKLMRQVQFLDANTDHVICCHNVWKADDEGRLNGLLMKDVPASSNVVQLARGDYIATASCMVRNNVVHAFPNWLENLPACDWPLDLIQAQYGKIGYMPRLMAAYRQHDEGVWSGQSKRAQNHTAIALATQIDAGLAYRQHAALQSYSGRVWQEIAQDTVQEDSLAIIDDVFPHPQSGFRYEEFTSYLETFDGATVYTTGESNVCFTPYQGLPRLIEAHGARHPDIRNRIIPYPPGAPLRASLAYMVFAQNAWRHLATLERDKVPFVFTLYPGGGFLLDDETSDDRLRRTFSSPMFRRVIVTQTLTRDYLLRKSLCPPDRISFIYGVVTPRSALDPNAEKKLRFGYGKPTLDICFTAHKYRTDGHDKGYDFFLDVARALTLQCPEAHFHVAGGFGPDDLPIDGLEGRITFHGSHDQNWFRGHYRDKDLILLANVPFVLLRGAFDGFPTGCGSDAMLSGTALFCTDPLKLNCEFTDGHDLVVIERDVPAVVERIMEFRNKPAALRALGEQGAAAARKVYSYNRQVEERIALLAREIGLCD